jgi:tellurite methyltransferase
MTMMQLVFNLFLASLIGSGPAHAGRPHSTAANDPSTYEAITGDSADDDRTLWDSFYKNKSNAFGKEAVGFLKDHLHEVKKGHAFVPAMGEGRNAIFLAKSGFKVDGNDLSEIAVDRALDTAKLQKVEIKGIVADLTDYKYPENYYDLVMVSLFYMGELIPKFKKSVKHGGYIMFYEKLDTGKPAAGGSPDDFLVRSQDLKNALKDFDIKIFKEYKDHDVDVVGVLARKL